MKKYKRNFLKHQTSKEIDDDMISYWDWDDYEIDRFNDYPIIYEYLYEIEDDFLIKKYSRINSIRLRNVWKNRALIDLRSVLSKERIREEKINSILSDIQDMSNTIENILKFKQSQS